MNLSRHNLPGWILQQIEDKQRQLKAIEFDLAALKALAKEFNIVPTWPTPREHAQDN